MAKPDDRGSHVTDTPTERATRAPGPDCAAARSSSGDSSTSPPPGGSCRALSTSVTRSTGRGRSGRSRLLALLIGLPVVLVLAWYHGDRGQQRISEPRVRDPDAAAPARRRDLLVLPARERSALAQAARWRSQPHAATPPEAAPAPDEKSIAVLPFVDMSAEKDQEYMSDGIAEELLNLLAKVPDLKVIARTSSFAFKGEKSRSPRSRRELNVAHVLEGSVRKSGNKLASPRS